MRNQFAYFLSLSCVALLSVFGFVRWEEQHGPVIYQHDTLTARSLPGYDGTKHEYSTNLSELIESGVLEFFKGKRLHGSVYRPYHTIFAGNTTQWTCRIRNGVHRLVSGDWQTVIDDVTYVYSAYLDPRPQNTTLRVFGTMRSDNFVDEEPTRERYYCLVWSRGHSVAIATEAHLVFAGRRLNSFMSVQLLCEYDGDVTSFHFTHVSIVTTSCGEPSSVIKIQAPFRTGMERDFTICVSGPIKHGYNNTGQFVEWVEANRLLGADRIYMYNLSIGEELLPYIRHYQAMGLLYVLPWSLPIAVNISGHEMESFDVIWNFGQVVALQDCLYRTMHRSRYLVSLDLDELIVPRRRETRTWAEMLTMADCETNKSLYIARNTFFPTDIPDSEEFSKRHPLAKQLNLVKLLKTQRNELINEKGIRSKYIVKPESVVLLHVHHSLGTRESINDCVLSEDICLLHHYRDHQYKENMITDSTIHKYADEIIVKTLKVHEQVSANS